jgi:hypothetical protein
MVVVVMFIGVMVVVVVVVLVLVVLRGGCFDLCCSAAMQKPSQ